MKPFLLGDVCATHTFIWQFLWAKFNLKNILRAFVVRKYSEENVFSFGFDILRYNLILK